MANVGPKLTIPFTVGTGQIVGQGNNPELWTVYTTEDASNTSPIWNDASQKVRAASISRGRNTELEQFDAGTASITLDNRDRTFDPVSNAGIKPMNRWWLREQFSGETRDLLKGYAESYTQAWSQGGITDATATVQIADEVKVLSLDRLPTTSPPRDTYADVIAFDNPSGYWRLDDPDGSLSFQPAIGSLQLNVFAGAGATLASPGTGPIVGDTTNRYVTLTGASIDSSDPPTQGMPGDAAGLSAFTAEAWIAVSDTSTLNTCFKGPLPASGSRQWIIQVETTGAISFVVHTSVSTYTASTGPNVISGGGPFLHLVGVFGSNLATLYVNGQQAAQVATSGTVITGYFSSANNVSIQLANLVTSTSFDEVAFYRYALSAARVQAHYDAGANRGFASQSSDARVRAVLDASTSSGLPRSWTAGVYTLAPRRMANASPMDKITEAVQAEATDAAFFVAADGTLTFLASNHRSSSPYNTVQATFDDDGTDLPYLDMGLDYSESFLSNEWNVTRDGGVTQTTSDATSISKYFKRSQSLTGLALVNDSDAATIAAAMLAKYKDPFTRVTSIAPKMADAETARSVYALDLMDRIRIFRTPPGGGSRIDQTLFIQKIEHVFTPGVPPACTLGVSPL